MERVRGAWKVEDSELGIVPTLREYWDYLRWGEVAFGISFVGE